MLSKLLKYELKSTARWFLPLYIALIVLTFLNKFTITINLPDFILFNILKALLMFFYVLIIIFTSIATMILLVIRFYKNLYTDEGYLTHTLPIKPCIHLNCKILSGCIWIISSFFMQAVSLFILFMGEGIFSDVTNVFVEIIKYLKSANLFDNAVVTLIIFGITLIISLLYNLLMMYCSISVGSLFSQHRIIGAIVVYFIINFVIQLFSMLLMLIGIESPLTYEITTVENFSVDIFNIMNIIMLISCAITMICNILFYLLSHFVISKKLNLD